LIVDRFRRRSTIPNDQRSTIQRSTIFENLDVYRVAKEALALSLDERKRWKGLPGELSSQLERALVSCVLNIAEGAGRATRADQKRHYAIARGSAYESAAILSIVSLYRTEEQAICETIRARLVRVIQMLNKMCARA